MLCKPRAIRLTPTVGAQVDERRGERGPFQWVCAMSQLLNFEQMRLDGEIGGSVPQIDKLWPRDWRLPDMPMPFEGSVPTVLRKR